MVLVIGATACGDSGGSDAATCQGKTGQPSSTKAVGGETADGAGKKVGIVLDIGGKNDKSFNQAAAAGLAQAGKDFGVQTKLLEPNKDGSNREELLRSLADDGYQYIIGNGFLFADSLKKVAADYPDISFGITDDASFTAPNVTSLVFSEEQGSFLVGAAAALTSKTHTIGFVGGVTTDLIKKFEAGYEAGAKAADPDVTIKKKYISNPPDFSGFTDPASMKPIAEGMYEGDADVVYHAAGLSGTGLFPVAAEQDRLAIGVDSDQYQQVPAAQQKCMLTSMLKRVDLAVYESIKEFVDGSLKAGEHRFDLKSGGIDYSTDGGQLDGIKDKLESYKQDIISGKIKVPTTPS
jgi:basic membrane protein A